jgi:hypothetical protein
MKNILIVFFFVIPFIGFSQECDVTVFEAHEVIDQEATVCGVLMQVASPKGIRGNPTYLNMGKRYPDHPFTVVIWGRDFMQFPMGQLKSYEGRQIAVTGLVEEYRGKPQIVVKEVEQIVLIEE